MNGVGTTRPLPITKMQCLNDQTSDHGEDEDPRINHRRPLPQPGSSCKSQAQVAKPSLRAGKHRRSLLKMQIRVA